MKHSPMLQHALESFAHGLEHFLDGAERSRKFALLHIDQAVELFLKEKCIQLGKSIYKSDGSTLSVHETFRSLEKEIQLTERPRLEELHDLRNTVQHKGLTPDAATTDFYVHLAYEFAKRFLARELGLPIEGVLSPQHRALMEGPPAIPAAPELGEALREAMLGPSPADRIVRGYTVLARAVVLLAGQADGRVRFRPTLRRAAMARGVPKQKIDEAFVPVFMLRGQVLSSAYEPTDADAEQYLQRVREVLGMVGFDVQKHDHPDSAA